MYTVQNFKDDQTTNYMLNQFDLGVKDFWFVCSCYWLWCLKTQDEGHPLRFKKIKVPVTQLFLM